MLENYIKYIPYVIVLLIGVGYYFYINYFHKKNIKQEEKEEEHNLKVEEHNLKVEEHNLKVEFNDDFIQADGFAGDKEGYIFKKGDKGLGYYLDKN